ncbi:MAG: hypothetical protein GF400_04880 [Candidatus Eisenbacteria bacterium]|nr:hypothetical protein [Candidatus Eisenbacteria bacterium]
MRRKLTLAVALLLVGLALSGSDCIFEQKVVQLVVTGSTCVDFEEDHQTDNWTTPETYDVADELDAILSDNGIDKDQVIDAEIISVTYEVIDPPAHDWTLSGTITVEYDSGPQTIVNYTNQTLSEIDGVPKYADLNDAGVDEMHGAIDAYLADMSPLVTFRVENGDVDPDPSSVDPIQFTWRACLKIYVVVEDEYDWPDVFRG